MSAVEIDKNKCVCKMSTSDFKSASVGSYKYSDYFWMYGVKWRIELQPNGNKEENKGYISLWLNLSDFGAHKEIDIDFTFNIKEEYESKSGSKKFTSRTGSGWAKFCSNSSLSSKITIECAIKPKCDDMTVLFRPMTNRMNELKSQLESVKREKNNAISDLRKEMKTLKDDKIAGLEKKLDDAADYIPNPIVLPVAGGDSDQKEQALEPIAEHSDLYNKHIAIVTEWDKDTEQLKTLELERSELMKVIEAQKGVKEGDEKEDDEKENDGKEDDNEGDGNGDDEKVDEISSDKVIEEFFTQQQMVSRQLERIDKVPTDEHLGELRNHQNALYVTSVYNTRQISVNDSVFTLKIGIFERMGCDM